MRLHPDLMGYSPHTQPHTDWKTNRGAHIHPFIKMGGLYGNFFLNPHAILRLPSSMKGLDMQTFPALVEMAVLVILSSGLSWETFQEGQLSHAHPQSSKEQKDIPFEYESPLSFHDTAGFDGLEVSSFCPFCWLENGSKCWRRHEGGRGRSLLFGEN